MSQDHASTSDPASRRLEHTEQAQGRASDPEKCSWVSANAGAGKTHVLKMRVLRLLLAGVLPSRILCLTYTKAAASEMATRVFEELTEWAIAADSDLDRRLRRLTGRPPRPEELDMARQLFARAIETPGGLKVQTIHGFCEQLLQRFPLEAGLRPGFAIADDAQSRELAAAALNDTLARAADDGGVVGRALATMIAYAADEPFGDLAQEAARKRDWIAKMEMLAALGDSTQNRDFVDDYYRGALGATPDATVEGLVGEISGLVDDAMCEAAIPILSASKSSTDNAIAQSLTALSRTSDPQARVNILQGMFLTQDLTAKKTFITKPVAEEHGRLAETLRDARDRCEDLIRDIRSLRAIVATRALLDIASEMAGRFATAKQHHGTLDFDDLIARTVSLLEAGDAARWVLFKLDGGIEHILVDEAQDTSPQQWSIVSKLAEPFFDGESTAEAKRTVFAVGDEKQSIYSFQGAEPRLFGESGAHFQDRARHGAVAFEHVPLNLSFRTVAPILTAVDQVFADAHRTPGLSYSDTAIAHYANRAGQAGLVELWPLEVADVGEDAAPFSPLEDQPARSGVTKLCDRIGDTIADWLRSGRTLAATGERIRPGDIMILVRSRRPIAAPMIAALKARGIPVAGADRMVLTDQLAVQDLLSLGDFLTLPEDDLALANVLKSPLFDYTDDDLIRLAPARKGSLWSAMIASAKSAERDVAAVHALKRWRSEADFLPPFEFFSNLLSTPGHLDPTATYRVRLMGRLGPDASDPLDEFLESALRYDDEAAPSLQGFVSWLRRSEPEIKRDMDTARDEVRLMTVHGSKGLEAPIVFLPDTTSNPTAGRTSALLKLLAEPGGEDGRKMVLPETHVWTTPLGKAEPDTVRAAKDARRDANVAESNRLLYVAMTRARDELYICGCEPKRKSPDKPPKLNDAAWYQTVSERLDGVLSTADAHGIRRLQSEQTAEQAPLRHADDVRKTAPPLPAWARTRVASEPRLQIPIAPSRLAPLEQDDFGDPVDDSEASSATPMTTPTPAAEAAQTPPAPSPRVLAHEHRFLRGNVTHALLQHLPQLPPDRWGTAAAAFVDQRAGVLSDRARASIVKETLTVLQHPDFSLAFGAGSRAEVSIAAEIPNPTGQGPSLKIAGNIDRLAVTDHNVLIVDFKTNRPPPLNINDVPTAYVMQLAAYRLVVRQMFAGKSVDAALLWTDGANLMDISSEILDQAERALWTPRGPALDALTGQT